jgi:hypothetical protein
MEPVTVVASPWMPRWVPLKGWRRLAGKLGLPVKRTPLIFVLSGLRTYVVAPQNVPTICDQLRRLGVPVKLGKLKLVKDET